MHRYCVAPRIFRFRRFLSLCIEVGIEWVSSWRVSSIEGKEKLSIYTKKKSKKYSVTIQFQISEEPHPKTIFKIFFCTLLLSNLAYALTLSIFHDLTSNHAEFGMNTIWTISRIFKSFCSVTTENESLRIQRLLSKIRKNISRSVSLKNLYLDTKTSSSEYKYYLNILTSFWSILFRVKDFWTSSPNVFRRLFLGIHPVIPSSTVFSLFIRISSIRLSYYLSVLTKFSSQFVRSRLLNKSLSEFERPQPLNPRTHTRNNNNRHSKPFFKALYFHIYLNSHHKN